MGGGGLRILPHKSWNVWNYDNRERVRKDEAAAQAEANEMRRKAEEAEQEARLEVLRARAVSKRCDDAPAALPLLAPVDLADSRHLYTEGARIGAVPTVCVDGPTYQPLRRLDAAPFPGLGDDSDALDAARPKHINFFEDAEKMGNRPSRRVQKDLEAKAELEKEHKRLGVVTYLGQTVTDEHAEGKVPWWQVAPTAARVGSDSAPAPLPRKQAQHLAAADPLATMNTHLRTKERHDRDQQRAAAQTQAVLARGQPPAQALTQAHAQALTQAARLLQHVVARPPIAGGDGDGDGDGESMRRRRRRRDVDTDHDDAPGAKKRGKSHHHHHKHGHHHKHDQDRHHDKH